MTDPFKGLALIERQDRSLFLRFLLAPAGPPACLAKATPTILEAVAPLEADLWNLKGKDGSKQFFAFLGCNYLTGTETIAVSYRLNFDLGLNFYSPGSQEVRMR